MLVSLELQRFNIMTLCASSSPVSTCKPKGHMRSKWVPIIIITLRQSLEAAKYFVVVRKNDKMFKINLFFLFVMKSFFFKPWNSAKKKKRIHAIKIRVLSFKLVGWFSFSNLITVVF